LDFGFWILDFGFLESVEKKRALTMDGFVTDGSTKPMGLQNLP
jgi:hypothetical protein